jgi:hypothetical protein
MMTKAEELARKHAECTQERHNCVRRAVDEAMEWAAEQCESASSAMEANPDNEFDGLDTIDVVDILSRRIRSGKSA